MDSGISRSESSSSFFFHQPKSSSPIEIPGRHHDDDETAPPTERTMSPELIFEMEPFSPLDPELASTTYSNGLSTSIQRTKDDREPLLYSFPMLSAAHLNPERRAPLRTAGPASSFSLPPIAHKAPARQRRRSQALQLKSPRQTPSPSSRDPDPAYAIRAEPVHKITGFKPAAAFAAQAPAEARANSKKALPREKHPALPPHRRSLSPLARSRAPWARHGLGHSHGTARSEASDDELLRSLEVDPGAVDFTQFLLRRIDSQKPLQFQTFQTMSMMSVSVR
ncbi:hypothetical protein C8F04DRAFT_679327 [Mycena alexandri]|uniref:Uncharacterized protein n=1 Tax=Mycena alexandri TaxID=1745969 RepID=A0AAD6TES7_9AGAR|nr:hypothetical protein C8F04DRAFT_679327 [Mycena alexandri]